MSFSNLHSRVVRLIEHENSAEIATDALDEIAVLAAKQHIKRATEHMPGFDTRLANWQPMRTVRDREKVIQGLKCYGRSDPGRCPGLACHAPLRQYRSAKRMHVENFDEEAAHLDCCCDAVCGAGPLC